MWDMATAVSLIFDKKTWQCYYENVPRKLGNSIRRFLYEQGRGIGEKQSGKQK